jgi:cold-inducible RNA-binding protein
MGSKLHVGNLGCSVARVDLENLFADHGDVLRAGISINPATGKNRGCGFVEMSSQREADAAIAALHGTELDGRAISVRAAAADERAPSGREPSKPGRQAQP